MCLKFYTCSMALHLKVVIKVVKHIPMPQLMSFFDILDKMHGMKNPSNYSNLLKRDYSIIL